MRTILIPTLTVALAAATASGASAQRVAFEPASAPQSCAATERTTTQQALRGATPPTAAGSFPVIVTAPKPGYGGACRPSAATDAQPAAPSARPATPAAAPVPSPVLPIPSVG